MKWDSQIFSSARLSMTSGGKHESAIGVTAQSRETDISIYGMLVKLDQIFYNLNGKNSLSETNLFTMLFLLNP